MFQCGQGDTILLQLATEKWVLIDCNLPVGVVRDEFFNFVDSLRITRLDVICLTHPHDDHYTGMAEIIRYFTKEGRTIGAFCFGGTEPREIVTLMTRRNRPDSSIREYERIYLLVDELLQKGAIRLIRADENTTTITVAGRFGEVQLIPIGPRTEVAWRAVRATISSEKIRTDLNALSVVLALLVRGGKKDFDALLAADTNADGFKAAMDSFAARLRMKSRPEFNMVKVSHHGSLDSHAGSEVCEYRKATEEAIAAVSAGAFDVLPDSEVLRDFLEHGWTVLMTTKRISRRRHYAIEIFGKRNKPAIQTRTLRLQWSESGGLKWEPPEAQVILRDLSSYETAKAT